MTKTVEDIMELNNLQNPTPMVHERMDDRIFTENQLEVCDVPYDDREVFDYIRDIQDPEHPLTLEELGVVQLEKVKVEKKFCYVEFSPTIPYCSVATLIGLAIKVQLIRLLPSYFKIDVCISPGSHVSEVPINKQLADKERVAAALENINLLTVINECILSPIEQPLPEFVEKFLKKNNKLDDPKVKYVQQSRQNISTYQRWHTVINDK